MSRWAKWKNCCKDVLHVSLAVESGAHRRLHFAWHITDPLAAQLRCTIFKIHHKKMHRACLKQLNENAFVASVRLSLSTSSFARYNLHFVASKLSCLSNRKSIVHAVAIVARTFYHASDTIAQAFESFSSIQRLELCICLSFFQCVVIHISKCIASIFLTAASFFLCKPFHYIIKYNQSIWQCPVRNWSGDGVHVERDTKGLQRCHGIISTSSRIYMFRNPFKATNSRFDQI